MAREIKVVLLGHGEGIWNLGNTFTGWTDMDLSDQGVCEAHRTSRFLKVEGYLFDVAPTSVLKGAIRTLWIVLDGMDLMWIPVHRSWRLNERHYGALQGLDKRDTVERYGQDQVRKWRRSYDIRPPALAETDSHRPKFNPRYAHLKDEELPGAESLKDTLNRVLPYWHETMLPNLWDGKHVLISAHGDSLQALVKYLDNISDDEIIGLTIPTGVPLVCELDGDLRLVTHYYLGDEGEVKRATESVARKLSGSRTEINSVG